MEQQDPEESKVTKRQLERQDSLRLKSQEEGDAFFARKNDTILNGFDSPPSPFGERFFSPRSKVVKNRAGSIGQIFPRVKHKMRSPVSSSRSSVRSLGSRTRSRTVTDTSDSSYDVSDVSDFESDVQFSDLEDINGFVSTGERRKCFTKPEQQYNDIQTTRELQPTKREMTEFNGWLRDTVKILPSEFTRDDIEKRLGIFLHFFRLDISSFEITSDNIATHEIWHERNQFVMEVYVSYLKVPLDANESFSWWLSSDVPDIPQNNESKHVYICHRLQTFSETQQRSRRARRQTEKRNFTIDLMKGNPISVFTTSASKLNKSRERHISWAINWVTSSRRKVPHHLRVSAGRVLASIAWPDERIKGIRTRLWESGVTQKIICMCRTGEIQLHKAVLYETVSLDQIIGKGAVGTVYSAIYNGQSVAVKVSKEATMAFTEEEFLFEVALMCALEHPNILPCLGAGIIAPYYFFISPYQGKGSLKMVLNDHFEPLPWSRRIYIATEVAKGLQYLHSKGLMHRDIKSENILVGINWEIRIIDFGTSRFAGKTDQTALEPMIGTAEWMAPEILAESKYYTDKVDVYSFGILLYEIFTRNHPYCELERRFEIISHVLNENRPSYREVDVPFKSLRSLMVSCWHKSAKKRPGWNNVLDKLEDAFVRAQKKEKEDASVG